MTGLTVQASSITIVGPDELGEIAQQMEDHVLILREDSPVNSAEENLLISREFSALARLAGEFEEKAIELLRPTPGPQGRGPGQGPQGRAPGPPGRAPGQKRAENGCGEQRSRILRPRFPLVGESGCRDLNPGPLDPQSSALTKLRHSPCGVLPVQEGNHFPPPYRERLLSAHCQRSAHRLSRKDTLLRFL